MKQGAERPAAVPTGNQWGIHWKSPTLMLVFYTASVVAALGHHLLYSSLDGSRAHDQDWYLRAGTVIAVIAKTTISASVGIAFTQWAWKTVRSKFLALGAIDELLGATNNPISIFNTELVLNAKPAMTLALLTWLSPLLTIFAPAALTVSQRVTTFQDRVTVSNLNFTTGPTTVDSDARNGTYDLVKLQVVVGKQAFQYYDGASKPAIAVIYETIYQGEIAKAASPCGANCSFTQSFVGLKYRCIDADLNDITAPWCHTNDPIDGPNGTCNGLPVTQELYVSGNSTEATGSPGGGWGEGIIWVLHRYFPPENRVPWNASFMDGSLYQNIAFKCQLWNTRFDIRRTFTNFDQDIKSNTTYLDPIPGYNTGENATYWASYAIHETMFSIFANTLSSSYMGMVGNIWTPSDGLGLTGTKFVEKHPWPKPIDYLPVRNFRDLLEEASTNLTLSLFSMQGLSYLYPQPDYLVDRSFSGPIFVYNRRAMLITYGVGLAMGLLAVMAGAKAYSDNGVGMTTGFLSIMTTTRNPTLDQHARAACLGSDPAPEELRRLKVRFGELLPRSEESGKHGRSRHAAFGVEGQVVDLRRNEQYE